MNTELRNIIVIGASAGGFEALKKLAAGLPPDMRASIFIVWHISPDVHGVLPHVINRQTTINAVQASDYKPIVPNRIYVAPPDHHLLLESGYVRVTRGPRENRFRPAVDPLFRSAAYVYGARVIGVVLSGALDDGTAGLWTIKQRGGLAIVQDPNDAEVPSMPESALREIAVDYCVPIAEMADLLTRLSQQQITETSQTVMNASPENEKTKAEIQIAAQDSAFSLNISSFGEFSPYACPECHGVMSTLKDGKRTRYRCHTGHAFSADSLMATITEKIEDSLYSAMRGVEESAMLLNHLGDHYAEANQPKIAAVYFQKAKEAEMRTKLIRQCIGSNEHLSKDRLRQQVEEVGVS